MNSLFAFLLITLFLLQINYTLAACPSTCEECATATNGCGWCLHENKCTTIVDCKSDTFLEKDPLNCPRKSLSRPFNESLARDVVLPLVAAAYNDLPSVCLKKKSPSTVYYDRVMHVCDGWNQGDNCSAYTAYDSSLQTIVISFRGSHGSFEMIAEFLNILKKQDMFVDVGKVFDYFDHAFYTVWNGGLEKQVQTLRKVFPKYKTLVVGHSLGGALAALCAVYLKKQGIVSGNDLELITFGEPRVGDRDFAAFVEKEIPASFRIVHNLDPIPRLPPLLDNLVHHRYELWYSNDMTPGKPYQLCPYADILNECSNKKFIWQFSDHTSYYHPPEGIPEWGRSGCA